MAIKPERKVFLKHLLYASFHSVWMIIFSLIWLEQVNVFDGFPFMNDIMDYKEYIEKEILDIKPSESITDNFLLVNTSKNNELAPFGDGNIANTVITDRKRLTHFLEILDKGLDKDLKFVKFIILDIAFKDTSLYRANDSALQAVITRLDEKQKIIIPADFDKSHKCFEPLIIKCRKGISSYKPSFLKTQYLKLSYILFDSIKQTPLLAYETVEKNNMKQHNLGPFKYYTMEKGGWCLNTIVPEFRFTNYDLRPDSSNKPKYTDLGDWNEDLTVDSNKIVIIGDIEGLYDKHHSMINQTPGPLILINAYCALEKGDNILRWHYLLLLFISFMYISFHTFYKNQKNLNAKSKKSKVKIFIHFLKSRRNYLLIILLTFISMFFYHFFLHLLILLSYIGVIEIIMEIYPLFKKKKRVVRGKK